MTDTSWTTLRERARRALKDGKPQECLQLTEEILATHGDDSDTLCIAAEAHLMQGSVDAAQPLAERAAQLSDNGHEAMKILGESHLEKWELAEAERCFEAALSRRPSSHEVADRLAATCRRQRRYEESQRWQRRALRDKPKRAAYHSHLAQTLAEAGEVTAAISEAERAIQLDRRCGECWQVMLELVRKHGETAEFESLLAMALQSLPGEGALLVERGRLLALMGQPEQAEAHYRQLIARDPLCLDAYHALGWLLNELNRHEEMLEAAMHAFALRPYELETSKLIGVALGQQERYHEAIPWLYRALEVDPGDDRIRQALATTFNHTGEHAVAIDLLEQVLQRTPDNALVLNSLGVVYLDMGQIDQAINHLRRSIELDPDNIDPQVNLAVALSNAGEMEEAIALYEKVLRAHPQITQAYKNYAKLKKFQRDDPMLQRMQALLDDATLPAARREEVAYALHIAYEGLKEYDDAFNYLQQGAALHRTLHHYALADDEATFDALMALAGDLPKRLGDCGSDDATPIFILGMPRSGTTLVEQILASHPEVFGAGELTYINTLVRDHAAGHEMPAFASLAEMSCDEAGEMANDYLQRLRVHADAPRITDKMPHNFLVAGLLATLFPNAAVIHCRRDAADTCLSIFKQRFTRGHEYAYSLNDLGHYYRLYERLMGRWQEVLPERILEVQYENMVENPEQEIRRLLDYCRLPWDPACLNFHESKRTVQTASLTQVRQPIYKKSRQSWRRYENHLGELFTALDYTPAPTE